MKEFLFVEFLFTENEYFIELDKLKNLGSDFEFIQHEQEYEYEDNITYSTGQSLMRVSGRINSMTASLIKLQNPALAGKMRISYITDELKNKYRK